ncbi:MAG: LysR family transcriptional regulator [Lachnospiraceae bacterium]|nr:LysR family transcriptional regulator [Lachnospiraceae bacterium]
MNIDVSLDLYKIFCSVVKTGNMSAAAKELYISQPAVSMSIKQLEDRLGSSLLVRTTKGVRTTPEGEVLYNYLEQALNLISTAEKKYVEMVNMGMGEIKIGASDTVISNFLMPYLEAYYNKYPSINIKVTNKTTYEALKLLKSGNVDMCFINLPIEPDDDIEIIECIKVHDCLIGGIKYKELSKSPFDIKDISKYPLLLLEELSNTRLYLNKYAINNGVELKPVIELGSNDLLLGFVKINLGLSFAIKEFSSSHIDGETIFEIPLNPPVPERAIGLAKLRNVGFSNAASRFIELMDIKLL